MTVRGKGSMSFNPSLLGQEFLEGEREALPGYKIKTANLLIIFSPRAAGDEKILLCREANFSVISAVNRP